MNRAWFALPLLGPVVLPDAAHAQTPASARPDFELRWSAPDDCPDQTALKAQVTKLAPHPAARDRSLHVDGEVRRGPDGFVLDLVLRDGEFEGRRRFDSDSCAEVVGAAAVTIALLLSSGATDTAAPGTADAAETASGATGASTAGPPATYPSTEPSTQENPRAVELQRSPVAPPLNESEYPLAPLNHWRLVLAAPSLSFGFGLLPEASLGLGGGLGVEYHRWRLLVMGLWNFETGVSAGDSDQGADVSRSTLRLAACHWFGSSRWELAPCATLAVAYLVAHGVGAGVAAERASSVWVAGGPGVTGGLRLDDWLRLTVSAGLELQTSRPVLVIEGLGEVEQIGLLELYALVGAEWIF